MGLFDDFLAKYAGAAGNGPPRGELTEQQKRMVQMLQKAKDRQGAGGAPLTGDEIHQMRRLESQGGQFRTAPPEEEVPSARGQLMQQQNVKPPAREPKAKDGEAAEGEWQRLPNYQFSDNDSLPIQMLRMPDKLLNSPLAERLSKSQRALLEFFSQMNPDQLAKLRALVERRGDGSVTGADALQVAKHVKT